ncbi:hypothetical protein AB0156_28000, partial [Klebsiella pneumoniae]
VRQALQKRRGDWKRIADESGVSYSWISKFVNEHIPNPGFATLTDLHRYLTADRPTAEPAKAA